VDGVELLYGFSEFGNFDLRFDRRAKKHERLLAGLRKRDRWIAADARANALATPDYDLGLAIFPHANSKRGSRFVEVRARLFEP